MAGQGFHVGLAKIIADRIGKEFDDEMLIGVLAMDAFNVAAGSRRCSHFCGGAGCILPRYTELRVATKLQSWDSGHERSYLVDPEIRMRMFEANNVHIPESSYKDGMRIHLLGDRIYDDLVQKHIFDVSHQKDGIIIDRRNGKEMTGVEFRKEIYTVYPMLDQYLMDLAGITDEKIEKTKELLSLALSDGAASFIAKYLNFNSSLKWKDTEYFKSEAIDNIIEDTIKVCEIYFE